MSTGYASVNSLQVTRQQSDAVASTEPAGSELDWGRNLAGAGTWLGRNLAGAGLQPR